MRIQLRAQKPNSDLALSGNDRDVQRYFSDRQGMTNDALAVAELKWHHFRMPETDAPWPFANAAKNRARHLVRWRSGDGLGFRASRVVRWLRLRSKSDLHALPDH